MEKKNSRPREEDFEDVNFSESMQDASTSEEPAEEENEQKLWVILAIIGAGVLFAIVAILIFYGFKGNQRTIVTNASSSIPEETIPSVTQPYVETTSSIEESGIDEITKSETDEASSEETLPEEETEVITEEETESIQEESVQETEEPIAIEYGGVSFTIQNGEAILVRCHMADTIAEFADTVEGYPVTAIAADAFNGCAHIEYLDLPHTVTTIGDRAFANCANLQEVLLTGTVQQISASAFEGSPSASIVVSSAEIEAYRFASAHGMNVIMGDRLTPVANE